MPFYEYECGRCGANFTVKQRMSDPPLDTHADYLGDPDVCNGHVERLISVPSLKFVGSGFYVNDYRAKR
jgi:putative FmdB family regulatory protein